MSMYQKDKKKLGFCTLADEFTLGFLLLNIFIYLCYILLNNINFCCGKYSGQVEYFLFFKVI